MEKRLSFRPNAKIITLLSEIKGIIGPVSRTDIFRMSVDIAIEDKVDWKRAAERLKLLTDTDTKTDKEVAEFFQFKIDNEKCLEIIEDIKNTFDLKRVSIPYLIQLLFSNLLNNLKEKNNNQDLNSLSECEIDFQERVNLNLKISELLLTDFSSEAQFKVEQIKTIMQ